MKKKSKKVQLEIGDLIAGYMTKSGFVNHTPLVKGYFSKVVYGFIKDIHKEEKNLKPPYISMHYEVDWSCEAKPSHVDYFTVSQYRLNALEQIKDDI